MTQGDTTMGGEGTAANGDFRASSVRPDFRAFPARHSDWTPEQRAAAKAAYPAEERLLMRSQPVWRILGQRKGAETTEWTWRRSKQPTGVTKGTGGIEHPVSGPDAFAAYVRGHRIAVYLSLAGLLGLDLDIDQQGAEVASGVLAGAVLPGLPAPMMGEAGGFHGRGHLVWEAEGEGGMAEAKAIRAEDGLPVIGPKGVEPKRYMAIYDLRGFAGQWMEAATKANAPLSGEALLAACPRAGSVQRNVQSKPRKKAATAPEPPVSEKNERGNDPKSVPESDTAIGRQTEVWNAALEEAAQEGAEGDEDGAPVGVEAAAGSGWLPLRGLEGELPVFPLDALPADVQEAVKALWHLSRPALPMICTAALAAMNIPAAARWDIATSAGGRRMPASLYFAVIAASGRGKSSLDDFFKGFHAYSQACDTLYQQEHARWLKLEPEERANRDEPVSLCPQAGSGSTSAWMAAQFYWHNPFLYEIELDAHEGLGRRDDDYYRFSRSLFSAEQTLIGRKGEAGQNGTKRLAGTNVYGDRRLTKIHGIQPDFAASTLFSPDARSSGLSARYLVCHGDAVNKVKQDRTVDEQPVHAFAGKASRRLAEFNDRGEGSGSKAIERDLIRSEDGVLEAFYKALDDNTERGVGVEAVDGVLSVWVFRKAEHTLRIAATLAAWEAEGQAPLISMDHWHRAARIADFFEAGVSQGSAPEPDKMLAALAAKHGAGVFYQRDLYPLIRPRKRANAKVVGAIVEGWIEQGFCRRSEEVARGLELNPALLKAREAAVMKAESCPVPSVSVPIPAYRPEPGVELTGDEQVERLVSEVSGLDEGVKEKALAELKAASPAMCSVLLEMRHIAKQLAEGGLRHECAYGPLQGSVLARALGRMDHGQDKESPFDGLVNGTGLLRHRMPLATWPAEQGAFEQLRADALARYGPEQLPVWERLYGFAMLGEAEDSA